jgi:hypothetical protein
MFSFERISAYSAIGLKEEKTKTRGRHYTTLDQVVFSEHSIGSCPNSEGRVTIH